MSAKKLARLLCGLLCVILIAPAAACADSAEPADTTVAVSDASSDVSDTIEERTMLTDGLPNTDFNGYNFRILCSNFYGRDLAVHITYDELTGDPVNDELYYSRIYLEDRFNISITYSSAGDNSALETAVKNAVNGGDDAFDIQIGHDTITIGLGKNGFLYNLKNIKQFDFTKPWWPEMAVENMTLCGKMFAASNYMSYCGLHWTRAICVNKEYADSVGVEIPYNAVRDGTWTLDMLNKLVTGTSEDLDGNGKMNTKDKYGFATGGQTAYCLQEALDCSVYTKDSNGYPSLNINQDRLSTMVEKLRWLYKTSEEYISDGDFAVDIFKTGRALFAYTQLGDAYDTYRTSDVVYGFLPTPKLDENQETYINCCTDVPWAVPITVSEEQVDIIGTICEAMSCYNYNHVLPAYFEVALKSRTADAPDDAEMLQLIADTRTIGFAYNYQLTFNNIINDCVIGTSELSSYLAKSEKAADKALTKLIEKFEEMD